MNKELDEQLDKYFMDNKITEIPKTYKEKLVILSNLANTYESDLIDLEYTSSKLMMDDPVRVSNVNAMMDKEVKYLIARSFITDVKSEIRVERKENFKKKIKSIFKK